MRWRRLAPLLLAAVLLAGCSWPPPASQTAAPTPENATATPAQTGRPGAPNCLHLLATLTHGDRVARADGVALQITVGALCPEPLLDYAGACPGELALVELRGDNDPLLGFLREDGAVFPPAAPCPPRAPRGNVFVPEGFALQTFRNWNSTLAVPCEDGAADCWRYEPAPPGYYRFVVELVEKSGARVRQTVGFLLADLCADIHVVVPEGHAPRVVIDNTTSIGDGYDGEINGLLYARWCGEPGEHWVRYEDRRTGSSEEAILVFDATAIRIVPAPLRVEPPLLQG